MQLTLISRASAAASSKISAVLPCISVAGPWFSTLPFGGRDQQEDTTSKDALRNEPAKAAQEDVASQANPNMQSQPGDLAQPTAAEAAREQEEYTTPQTSVDRPLDMPEGTAPSTRGFDQLGQPSSDSQTEGEGLVDRGPGTSSGTSGAL